MYLTTTMLYLLAFLSLFCFLFNFKTPLFFDKNRLFHVKHMPIKVVLSASSYEYKPDFFIIPVFSSPSFYITLFSLFTIAAPAYQTVFSKLPHSFRATISSLWTIIPVSFSVFFAARLFAVYLETLQTLSPINRFCRRPRHLSHCSFKPFSPPELPSCFCTSFSFDIQSLFLGVFKKYSESNMFLPVPAALNGIIRTKQSALYFLPARSSRPCKCPSDTRQA